MVISLGSALGWWGAGAGAGGGGGAAVMVRLSSGRWSHVRAARGAERPGAVYRSFAAGRRIFLGAPAAARFRHKAMAAGRRCQAGVLQTPARTVTIPRGGMLSRPFPAV